MNIKEIIERFKNDKRMVIIMLAGVVGIFLLAMSNYSYNDDIDSNIGNVAEEKTQNNSIDDIEKLLEDKLSSLISSVKGAGNAEVAVTVSSSGEYVYAENMKSDTDEDSSSTDTEIVIFDQNDNEQGLIISIRRPDVLGVAVICEGGGSSVVKAEITQLITSLFGIGSDRVYVGAKP